MAKDPFRWDCEIDGCREQKRWNPSSLEGCLPRKCSFSDADAWVEISGHFLVIEEKGEWFEKTQSDRPTGQWMGLRRLAQMPYFTVWYIERHQDDGTFTWWDMRRPTDRRVITLEQLRTKVGRWGRLADAHPHRIPLGEGAYASQA